MLLSKHIDVYDKKKEGILLRVKGLLSQEDEGLFLIRKA